MTDIRDDAPPATAKHASATQNAAREGLSGEGDTLIARSVTINRSRDDLYRFWRDFPNLAKFMENVKRIDVRDDCTSHWVVAGPGETTVEWDAQITQDVPGEAIAWASTNSPDVSNSGRVEFRDAGERGTVVTATIFYKAPAGFVGKLIAKLFQREPGIQARRDLRRFKQLMETGEVATAARTLKQREEEIA
ncbi:SRPBCC family protein [Novosphingobium kaempferiae]|uniref:SRPBCC family protein n=1 Tax=Novosphingobium kaempferiae TaxID=2896849 RepID=UPI001E3E07E9|nr:SRPBCC family protein [Novosphingobium kaempferiae]